MWGQTTLSKATLILTPHRPGTPRPSAPGLSPFSQGPRAPRKVGAFAPADPAQLGPVSCPGTRHCQFHRAGVRRSLGQQGPRATSGDRKPTTRSAVSTEGQLGASRRMQQKAPGPPRRPGRALSPSLRAWGHVRHLGTAGATCHVDSESPGQLRKIPITTGRSRWKEVHGGRGAHFQAEAGLGLEMWVGQGARQGSLSLALLSPPPTHSVLYKTSSLSFQDPLLETRAPSLGS